MTTTPLDLWIFRGSFKPRLNAETVLPEILRHYDEFKDSKIIRDLKGKPHIEPHIEMGAGKNPLQFSLSHSGDCLVVGLIRDRLIGVDLEKMRPDFRFASLVKEYFSETEAAQFDEISRRQDARKTTEYFYRVWTTKEAIAKATGEGLSINLPEIEPASWEMRTLEGDEIKAICELSSDYILTLALEKGTPFTLKVFHG